MRHSPAQMQHKIIEGMAFFNGCLKINICFAKTGSDQNMIDAQVREVLSFFHKDNCKECIIKELRILAEAAPEAVLEFLKKEEQLGGTK